MTQKQINSVGHKCSRVLEQWMSGAVAVFININMLCKATVNSGCDVITSLKHQFSQASFPFLLLVITLQSLLHCFASVSLILSPKAITITKSLSHDTCHILTLILLPVWQSVEIICRDASSLPVHWTISAIGKPGWEFIASEQLVGAVSLRSRLFTPSPLLW